MMRGRRASQLDSGMASRAYEIRVKGSLEPAVREAFADMDVTTESCMMILSGVLDQPSLHALLARVRAQGLELLSIRQPERPPAG
jgi:hypothetical protein